MKTITQDNMDKVNELKLNASKQSLVDTISQIVVLSGNESHSDIKEIIRAIRRGDMDDIELIQDGKIKEHKEKFVLVMKEYMTNLPSGYMGIVKNKELSYYKFLEVVLSPTVLPDVLNTAYATVSRHGRVEKNYLIGQIRTELPRPRVSINARDYEFNLLRLSSELITGMKLTGTLLFDTVKKKSEILLPKRSGFPVNLDSNDTKTYNHLKGITRKVKFQSFTKVKGSSVRRKLKRAAKKYLAKHASMQYRVRRWLTDDDIRHLVSLEMTKTLEDHRKNPAEHKGTEKDIIKRFAAMEEQLIELKEYKYFMMKRMLDGRGRIYSMWSLMYSKLGKSLIEPINSYTMDEESMEEVKYHAYCTINGKVPYEEAIAKYSDKVLDRLKLSASNNLIDIDKQEEAYECIIDKEIVTLLETPIGAECYTNLGADYTNMGLMTHAAMTGDRKALDMANLGDETRQYDSHTNILDKFLSMAKDEDSTASLVIRLLDPDKYLNSDVKVTDKEIKDFRLEFHSMEYATKKLRSALRKGVKKLISQGLFHGQTSKAVAQKFGVTELEVVNFKTDVFGEAIRDVENIALWMKYNINPDTSCHSWKAPDGITCYSQYYMKSAYSVLYSSNPTVSNKYSTTQYVCDLPLLKVGKKWFSQDLPKNSKIKSKVNVAKLMGGYANITHSWEAFNMRSIIRIAVRFGVNVLDINDYVYSTPKTVKLGRLMGKRNYLKYTATHGNYFQNVTNHIAKSQGISTLEFTEVTKYKVNVKNNNCFTV